MRKLFFAISILTIVSCNSKKVVFYITDGDTLILQGGEKVRLKNIDCPEYTHGHFQPFGKEARQFTQKYLKGQEVTIKRFGHDKYGRTIADIYINGKYFNEMLVNAGLAYCYPKYCPEYLYQEELKAKADKIGLWSQPNISPYNFRHHKK